MKKFTMIFAALLASLSLGLAVTACGSDDSPKENATTGTTSNPAVQPSGGASSTGSQSTQAQDGNQMGDNNK